MLVRLRGAKLSAGKLRSLLPIYEERSVDRDLLEEGTRDLASYFQTQGYFDAKADYQTAAPANGEQLIDYHVDLGVRHKIVKLEIHGNHYFDDATIRERMSVIPATLVRYRYGRYSRNALDRDLDAIRDLYRANGFRDVEVTSRVLDDYNGAKAHIAIFIEITEGPQWFVSKLDSRRRFGRLSACLDAAPAFHRGTALQRSQHRHRSRQRARLLFQQWLSGREIRLHVRALAPRPIAWT